MKAELKDLSKTKKKISFEVPAAQVDASYQETYKDIRRKANIPGFRKGKVPDQMIEKYYGSQIEMDSLNHLLNKTYTQALKDHQLVPVTEPKFDFKPLEKNKDYSYTVEVEVRPSIDLKEYTGIKIKKQKADVKADEVNEELARLQESRAELEPAADDTALASGLVATVDFEGTIAGKPIEGGSTKGYVLEMGKGQAIKDIEDGIAGMKKDEERIIDVNYAEDYYDKNLAGKSAQFRIRLSAVHNKVLPKLDDEFAKDLGKESLDSIKKEIESFLVSKKEQGFKSEYFDAITEDLVKKHKDIEVPQGLIDEEVERTKKPKEEVEKNLRLQFVLDAVAQKESLKVEPTDVERRFQALAAMYQQPANALKKHYRDNNMLPQLFAQLLLEKTLDFLLDKATLHD